MAAIEITPELVQKMKAYFRITPQDEQNLTLLQDAAAQHVDAFLDRLFNHYFEFPETKVYFPNSETLRRARQGQRGNFLSLFSGQYDEAYFDRHLRVGEAHDQIGLLPRWYMGAYAFYITELIPLFRSALASISVEQNIAVRQALVKIISIDIALAWEKFYINREDRLERRIREITALSEFTASRVNELIEAKKELEDKIPLVNILVELAKIAAKAENLQDASEGIFHKLLQLLEMESGELFIRDERTNELVQVIYHGLYPVEFKSRPRLKPDECLPGWIALNRLPAVTQELGQDPRFVRSAIKEKGFRFYAGVPIHQKEKVVGVFGVASLKQHAWNEFNTTMLTGMGNLLSWSVLKGYAGGQR